MASSEPGSRRTSVPKTDEPNATADATAALPEDGGWESFDASDVSQHGGFQRLLAQGRKKGFLTAHDLSAAIPSEALTADQMEELTGLFGEHEVAVIEKTV
ncbi:MAG: hypothetical protein GY946_24400, partial [bacterium]|nr:hypothetical protein [bacterium]